MAKFIFQAGVFFNAPLYAATVATSVSVYDADTESLAQIWDDRDGLDPKSNPFTLTSAGKIEFYANAGRYNIIATNGGQSAQWNDVLIINPDAGGGGGTGTVDSVNGINGASVDNSDPANPVVSVAAGDGITASSGTVALSGVVPGRSTSSTAFTLTATDAGQLIETTGDDPVITIPTEASEDLGVGFTVSGYHHGAGTLTFANVGVTLRYNAELSNGVPQYAGWQLTKSRTAANVWILDGYLSLAP